MRHRASRPLLDPWRRLPRATARAIGVAARTSPTRASVAVLLTLGTGTAAFATAAATVDDSPTRNTQASAAASRAGTTYPDASTSSDADAPPPAYPSDEPGRVTPTDVPGESGRDENERAREKQKAGPAARNPGDPGPTSSLTALLRSGSPQPLDPEAVPGAVAPSRTAENGRLLTSSPAQARSATSEAEPAPDGSPPATGTSARRTSTPSPGRATAKPSPAAPTPTPAGPTPSSPTPDSPETAWVTPADTTPPETSLVAEHPERDAVVFSFSADEASSFSCSIDGAAWTWCTSPTTYSDLAAGWHVFAVFATDAAGNLDSTPAQTTWHVKGGRPE